jgi:YggT family protein
MVVDAALTLLFLFFLLLLARVVLSWVMAFSRGWTPKGAALVLAEGVYTITDPPVKAVRHVVPPIDIGGVRVDLAVIILFLLTSILTRVLTAMR